MRKSYEMTLDNGDTTVDVNLRLTLGAQVELKKKYKQNTFATIMQAMDDAEIASEVFTQALKYSGNQNTIKNGADLYDLLVDNGYAGYEGIGRVLLEVAASSGIISDSTKEKALKSVLDTFDDLFDEAFDFGEEEDEKNAK